MATCKLVVKVVGTYHGVDVPTGYRADALVVNDGQWYYPVPAITEDSEGQPIFVQDHLHDLTISGAGHETCDSALEDARRYANERTVELLDSFGDGGAC